MILIQQADEDLLRAHLHLIEAELSDADALVLLDKSFAEMSVFFLDFEFDQNDAKLLIIQNNAELYNAGAQYYQWIQNKHIAAGILEDINYAGNIKIGDTQIDDNQSNQKNRIEVIEKLINSQKAEYTRLCNMLTTQTPDNTINAMFL